MNTLTTHCVKGIKISALVITLTTLVLLIIALFAPSTLPQWLSIGSATIDIKELYVLAQLVTLGTATFTTDGKARTILIVVSALLMLLTLLIDTSVAIVAPAVLLPTLYGFKSLMVGSIN